MSQQTADVENVDPVQLYMSAHDSITWKSSAASLLMPSVPGSASPLQPITINPPTHAPSPQTLAMAMAQSPSSFVLAADVVRNDFLTMRPPSPPYVHVPTIIGHPTHPANTITPAPSGPGHLAPDAVALITGNRPQAISGGRASDQWQYEHRRRAQPILDFLYLGPLAVVRDHAWLQEEGITMIYAVRDGIMVGRRLVSVEKVAADLGLEVCYLDMDSRQELIRSFPSAIQLINAHMLRRHGAGKVLVVCETGNERSATLVAAYVMAMYGRDMVGAVQFVGLQRFCTNLDEEAKQLLLSYEQLLTAGRMTASAHVQENGTQRPAVANRKRAIEDMMDEDEDGDASMDGSRFSDRAAFVPYLER